MRRGLLNILLILSVLAVIGFSEPTVQAKAVVPDQVERLLSDLQDSNWIAANHAVEELAQLGHEVVARVIPLLEHEQASVRYRAVEVLAKIAQAAAEAVPHLEMLQWDRALHVAAAASRALAAIDVSFPTAGGLRQLMSESYPWLLASPLEDLLFFEAVHGDYKLYGFGSHAYAVDYSSDNTAFVLIQRQESGVFAIHDLSDGIDSTRVYHRTRNLRLPGQEQPAILLASSYFSPDVLPAHYVLDHHGVRLFVTGEWLLWDDDEGVVEVATVTPASSERVTRNLPWDSNHASSPLWSDCPWSQEDVFRAAPYERLLYRYNLDRQAFVLQSADPISFWAVALEMVEEIAASSWTWMERLLAPDFAEELRNKGSELVWETLHRMGSEALVVQGHAEPNTLQLQFADGTVIYLQFDRTFEETYQSKRANLNNGSASDPWVNIPLIRDIVVE